MTRRTAIGMAAGSESEPVRSDQAPQFIKPRNVLKDKVKAMPGRDLKDLLKAAEIAVSEQTANYPELAYKQVIEMEAALNDAVLYGAETGTHIARIVVIGHDLKGDGQSFGFHLITEIAHSLCSYIAAMPAFDDDDRTVIDAHISAIRAVITQKVAGDGGDIGNNLTSALSDLVTKTNQARSSR